MPRRPSLLRHRPAATRWLVAALRLLTLLVVTNLALFAPAVSIFGAFDDDTDCCSDCPLEQNGEDCPPGCPACHCAHGALALPPAVSALLERRPLVETPIALAPYEASVPRGPPLPGVFRPPRSSDVVA